MGLRFSPPSGSKDWEEGLNVAGEQFPENRVQGPGSLQRARGSCAPGARVSELASQSVPELCRPWGSWRRPGWGSGHLTFFFPALLLSCDQVLHPPKPSFPYLLRRGDESSSEKYVAFFTNWGASSKVDDPGDETLLEVPPLVVWVGFRIKSLVLRLCLCPLSPPVPLSVFSPHQASTPLVRWGQQ